MYLPLPVSPHDPAYRAACARREMEYLATERWRYSRALILRLTPDHHAAWATLGLHPMTETELGDRLVHLHKREKQVLDESPAWLRNIETGALVANTPFCA